MVEEKVKVLAIVPYHEGYCAGQRFRIELWAKELEKRGFVFQWLPFSTDALTDLLHHPGKRVQKASGLVSAFVRQSLRVRKAEKPDLIYLYREAALAGPAIIERYIQSWNVPIVYDIDEPLFVPYLSPSNGILSKLKFFSKVDGIFAMSDKVLAVNRAIADYAGKFNDNVDLVPMALDLERYRPAGDPDHVNPKPVLVWVGTRTNQPNIEAAVPALRTVRETHDFSFRIIADYEMDFDALDVEFVPWSLDREIAGLQTADIGLVPVNESGWSKWKFFFKTIQYMAVGIPVVASAAGSNLEIIEDGVNGFLAANEREWREKINLLIENPELRKTLGANARQTVIKNFDIKDQIDFLDRTFKQLASTGRRRDLR